MNLAEIQSKSNEELLDLAIEMGVVDDGTSHKRNDLMSRVLQSYSEQNGHLVASGILAIVNDGYGFLRQVNYFHGSSDVYVSQSQIRRFGLRSGDEVTGQVRPPKDGERYFGLVRVEAVNGVEPEASRNRPHFENLTPIFPLEAIKLETTAKELSTRLIDLLSPVGRGQRGMIVSPGGSRPTATQAYT